MIAVAVRHDTILASAVDQARSAASDIADPGTVGEHLGMRMDSERLATHLFVCTAPAYRGWAWAVTVARIARSRHVTICETHLVPGEEALLAPDWIPYAQRLEPGDLGAGDELPYIEDDQHLEQGFEATGEEDVDRTAFHELGLGRRRVLSAEGREAAAQRWYDGDHGPYASVAEKAPEKCSSCGYYLPMAGTMRAVFGVCANAWSPSDGRVVSLDHGCGAHSETDVVADHPVPVSRPLADDMLWDALAEERV
ncbi:DUF3027 domain-containing protein [Austwickia chelonae]|uniref:DUF3027 domain-containing protein n=1 Tax=Austwickia chelonae NBRC 105200 TaxID=1184607 RepID=K6VMH8_9MICO|nr:DUF3027 domain-containing protein [Austwickia chelonae]GAB77939.1 hypothetical protein AUCHE_08_01820 [Austwickia chelonae NBRC 105200]